MPRLVKLNARKVICNPCQIMLSARDNISYGNDRNGDDGLNDNNGDVYSSGYSESEAERSVEKDSMSQHNRCLTA